MSSNKGSITVEAVVIIPLILIIIFSIINLSLNMVEKTKQIDNIVSYFIDEEKKYNLKIYFSKSIKDEEIKKYNYNIKETFRTIDSILKLGEKLKK